MCGIVGYIGKNEAAPILLEGLTKLEYRGYDSAGIAVEDDNNNVNVVRAKGRLQILKDKTNIYVDVKATNLIDYTVNNYSIALMNFQ